MSMTDLNEDDLHEDQDDDSPLVRKLRSQLKAKSKEAKEAAELRSKLAEREERDAFREAGLDLTERQAKALKATLEGEQITAESVRQAAVELKFIEAEPDPLDEEMHEQDRIAEAGRSATSKGGQVITPATFEQWPPDKRLQFRKDHPKAFADLARGDEVQGLTY